MARYFAIILTTLSIAGASHAQEGRSYFSKEEVQKAVVGKSLTVKTTRNGQLFKWTFHEDGRWFYNWLNAGAFNAYAFANGSGRWRVGSSGSLCTQAVGAESTDWSCSHIFRDAQGLELAGSSRPDARIFAHVEDSE